MKNRQQMHVFFTSVLSGEISGRQKDVLFWRRYDLRPSCRSLSFVRFMAHFGGKYESDRRKGDIRAAVEP